ncbi:multi antimicrobial extrusion protein [Kipferlia bialata]|uniref:Multi antimicrobial extrusion protein n=1 Tax=Kipferlia bialata TaxID=797122 RepID=A0A9K3GJT6_9EUKA|nr:multi antimicrobial extrusion protein [Kipferlia bialata]|eukprot:g6515.t1
MEWILLNVLGCSDEVLPVALSYLNVIFLLSPLGYYLTITFVGSLRIENRAQLSMILEIVAALLNIIGDPIFLGALDLGIKGAAFSTVISEYIVGAAVLWYYLRPGSTSQLAPDFKGLRSGIQFDQLGRMFASGLGVFTDLLNPTVCSIVNNLQIAAWSDTVAESDVTVAAMGLGMRFQDGLFMPMVGICQGLIPVLGYSIGQNNQSRMSAATLKVSLWALVFSIVCCAGILIFTRPLIKFFSDDEDVIDQAVAICRPLFAAAWLQSMVQMAAVVTQAFHHIKRNLSITLLRPVLSISFAYILPHFMGVSGVWMGFLIADVITGLCGGVVLAVYVRGMRKRAKEQEEEEESKDLESGNASDTTEGEKEVEGEREESSKTASLEGDAVIV